MSYAVGKWSGLSRGMSPSDFDSTELARGTRVEMEHTNNPRIAQRIAMDHLSEDSLYYQKLALIHAGIGARIIDVIRRPKLHKEGWKEHGIYRQTSRGYTTYISAPDKKTAARWFKEGHGFADPSRYRIGIGADMTDFQRQDLDLRKTAMTWEILSSIAFAVFGLILFTRR